MRAPTSLTEAQEALKRALEGQAEAREMRPTTDKNVRDAKRLLTENHLARRIRESYQ